LIHRVADQSAGDRANRPANQGASGRIPPGNTAPEAAPTAPPVNAPVPVLFGSPFGYWQPVITAVAAATANIKASGFMTLIWFLVEGCRPIDWSPRECSCPCHW
jgi:hypothetical protein